MLLWIKRAMIFSFLKQVLKIFWDNCELVVLSHLLEKFSTFFANVRRVHFFVCFFNCLWKAEFLCQPISEYWNRTTTSIPFLQAIIHFCNFLTSNFMEWFAFLIDDTLRCGYSGAAIFGQFEGACQKNTF